jgi:two-component system LytT family response regulator
MKNIHLSDDKPFQRNRVVVKKGREYQTVRLEDVVCFYSAYKIIFLYDRENHKYITEKKNLRELEYELSPDLFYRANRQYIINVNYIKSFRSLPHSNISVEMVVHPDEKIIISQENAAAFKRWING